MAELTQHTKPGTGRPSKNKEFFKKFFQRADPNQKYIIK
jgi:hypothetical protein